jgi:L-alanine-DL-glutamate epimerase-like enolase superfamily enzyme
MKIEAIDFFYISMPVVTDAGDGSQDALLVRVRAGGITAWGECEASPLTSIASSIAPMSHGACRPVSAQVLGEDVSSPKDIARLAATIRWNCMDLLQAAHTWSGIEIALWDLLGQKESAPVYKLLGYDKAYPKVPYASQLFGDTPQETYRLCRNVRETGYRAVKCGWGPFGRGTVKDDADHLRAAREGIGAEGTLLIDAGQIFGEDVDAAAARLGDLEAVNATWFEEPFNDSAYEAYGALAKRSRKVRLAGGEAAHNVFMARHTIDYGGVGFIQIDCGRIGGIGPAKVIADYAVGKGVTYVNHTFTTHLALCASIQPFAGLQDHRICEYPVRPQPMAWEMCKTHIAPNAQGEIVLPEKPGLGIEIDMGAVKKYLVEAEIKVAGKVLYRTPSLA